MVTPDLEQLLQQALTIDLHYPIQKPDAYASGFCVFSTHH